VSEDIKKQIRHFYGNLAKNAKEGNSCCCSGSCCGPIANAPLIYGEEFLEGLPEEALAASQGCANPLVFADLKEGDVVLDLGSGGGIDAFLAARIVGDSGKVYGLDMTDDMLSLAEENRKKAGLTNVKFIKGYIEDIPLPDESIDVVISNCVVNLSEDKEKVFREIYRVIKKGGHLSIADIVTLKEVPDSVRQMTDLWVSCIAGSMPVDELNNTLAHVGFKDISISVEHVYTKDVIKSMLRDEAKTDSVDFDLLDGAFGSAVIKAVK